MRSSNAGGTSIDYAYDALNRLSTAKDNRLTPGTTSYSYDAAGNLGGYLYPNGVQTRYTYNTLNRLGAMSIAKSGTLASYAYTLGAAGNRTAVAELGGRQVNYTYDALYRLTNETIAGGSVNGAIGYAYDAVGNRLARTSTVAAVPPATSSYDANDRLTTETYDNDGNTTISGGNIYGYDFQNHLKTQTGGTAVSIVYDGDGNRVAKTVSGVTTKYLVDDRNLTGYAQVMEELVGGTIQRVYTYGLNRISQSLVSGATFYGYDGHGNVRLLTNATGAVTDRYDYDAFGNILSQAGSTPNGYLYSGEQNDTNLGLYYLRARYVSQARGRFWTMDNDDFDEDNQQLPIALNKYLYVDSNPANLVDPSGHLGIADVSLVLLAVDLYDLFSTIEQPRTGTILKPGQASSDVSISIDRKTTTALTTMGALSVSVGGQVKFNGFSLEPSGTNGANRLSTGSYPASVYSSPHFGFNVLLLGNTDPMTDVEIHPGNTWQDTRGCILPGTVQSLNYVGNSRLAFSTIMNLVTNAQQLNASKGRPTSITVTVQ